MTKSIIKLSAIVLVIAGRTYLAICGFAFTEKAQIYGIKSEGGITQGLDLNGGSIIVR